MTNTVRLLLSVIIFLTIALPTPAHGMDHGFDPDDPAVKWFESLMIPPNYAVSCCGKADAYPVDTYEILPNGDMVVTVADGSAKVYPDGTRRMAWDESVKITVPKAKVNRIEDQANNPTEHGWLFFQPKATGAPADGSEPKPSSEVVDIYCYIPQPKAY